MNGELPPDRRVSLRQPWPRRSKDLLWTISLLVFGCHGAEGVPSPSLGNDLNMADAGDLLPECTLDGPSPNREVNPLVIFPEEINSYDGDGRVVLVAQRGAVAQIALDGVSSNLEVRLSSELSRPFTVGETFGVSLRTDGGGDVSGILFLYEPGGELLAVTFNYGMSALNDPYFTERFPLPLVTYPVCLGSGSCYTAPSVSAAAVLQTASEDLDLAREVTYDIELFGAPFKLVSHDGVFIKGTVNGRCADAITSDYFAFDALRADLGN